MLTDHLADTFQLCPKSLANKESVHHIKRMESCRVVSCFDSHFCLQGFLKGLAKVLLFQESHSFA